MTLFTFQMLPIDHRIKQKLLIIATKPLFHISPSFHPELISDHLLYTLSLQTLALVVIVVVVQICQLPFHLGSPALFLLPGTFYPMASCRLLHLIIKVLAPLSPPQRFPWPLTCFGGKLIAPIPRHLLTDYPVLCFVVFLLSFILILYLPFLPYWYMKTMTLSDLFCR